MSQRCLPAIACALIVSGCATGVRLDPAPEAQRVSDRETAATGQVAGVQVTARPDAWPGEAPISREVMPMRVTVGNSGQVPVRMRYGDFRLEAAGRAYRALPPFEITGTVSEPVATPAYGPLTKPGFDAVGFGVAPAYSTFYPGFPVAADAFGCRESRAQRPPSPPRPGRGPG
jgi:hypothetical protein